MTVININFSDEKNSEKYGGQSNIGYVTCSLSVLRELKGTYDIAAEKIV